VDQRDKDAFMLMQADSAQLASIAKLIDAGDICVFVAKTFPLQQARDAYASAKEGQKHGKIVLRVA